MLKYDREEVARSNLARDMKMGSLVKFYKSRIWLHVTILKSFNSYSVY